MAGGLGYGGDDGDASRKRARRDAATYGVFGEDADAEGGEGGAFGGGLGFGSRGIGLGGAPAAAGLGFAPNKGMPTFVSGGVAAPQDADDAGGAHGQPQPRDDAPLPPSQDDDVLPTAFGARIKERAERRRERSAAAASAAAERVAAAPDAFAGLGSGAGLGAPTRGGGGGGGARAPASKRKGAASDVGAFEAHTKGIGAKLLAKMGWKAGEGIGMGGKGIAKPIETHLRPKGMGLGAGGFDETRGAPGRRRADSDEEGDGGRTGGAGPGGEGETDRDIARARARQREQEGRKGMWQKRAAPKRAKDVYKTAEEVLLAQQRQQGGAPPGGAAAAPGVLGLEEKKLTVVDMRGPSGPRVVSNMNSLALDAAAAPDVPMPELQHNVRLVVDVAEARIRDLERQRRTEESAASAYAREATLAEAEAEAASTEHGRLAGLLAALEARERLLTNAAPSPPASASSADEQRVSAVAKLFCALRERFGAQCEAYGVARVALGDALPAARRLMRGWEPLAEPARGAAAMGALRRALDPTAGGGGGGAGGGGDAPIFGDADAHAGAAGYAAAVEACALAPLRSAVTNPPPRGWCAREPEALLAVLEAWRDALPDAQRADLLASLVAPKLARELERWEPGLSPSDPLHAWLHPWLPWIGEERLRPLWEPVRRKLQASLEGWEPADPRGREALGPWRAVLGRRDWGKLLSRAVVPPLAQRFVEAFGMLAALLEAHFFPGLLRALHAWLLRDPDLDAVSAWYLRWKERLPEDVAASHAVRNGLNAALDMMNAAVADAEAFAVTTAEQYIAAPAELVSSFAEEHGLLFQPKAGRLEGGHQVYSLGGVSVTLDTRHERVEAWIGGRWAPASLNQILEEDQRRRASA
eukprot:PRCOL_00003671-RA